MIVGVDFIESFMAIDMGRPLLGQRVFDLLAVLQALAHDHPAGFEIIASGSAGPAALHAAALDARITKLTLSHALISWSNVARAKVSIDQLTDVVPGVLGHYDLPDLAASIAPREVHIENAVDAGGNAVIPRR